MLLRQPQSARRLAGVPRRKPGGFVTAQVFGLLQALGALPFIATEGVQVAPADDHQELTSRGAAHPGSTRRAGRVEAASPTPP